MLQSLGSPEALFAMIVGLGRRGPRAGHRASTATRVGPAEWIVREWFLDGFAPFPEYCAWADRALLEHPASCSGCAPRSSKEACACDGAPACEYRVRWFPDDAAAAAEYFETRIQVLTARLEVAAGDGRRSRLRRRPRAASSARSSCPAARTISAPVFVLALEALPSPPTARVRGRARRRRGRAPRGRAARRARTTTTNDHLVVEVQSNRRRYGRLAAVNPTGRFFPQERVVLAGLRAAGRGRARLRRRARRRPPPGPRPRVPCSTCRTRWPTSQRPTRWPPTSRARSPAVIGCDRAAVILFEPGRDHRVASSRPTATRVGTTCACASMEVPVAQIAGRRRRRQRLGPREPRPTATRCRALMDELGTARSRRSRS